MKKTRENSPLLIAASFLFVLVVCSVTFIEGLSKKLVRFELVDKTTIDHVLKETDRLKWAKTTIIETGYEELASYFRKYKFEKATVLREVKEQQKLQSRISVLIIGASSIAGELGRQLERTLKKKTNYKVYRYGVVSSSVVEPDYFNWHRQAKKLVRKTKPDLVVMNFGGNEGQRVRLRTGTIVNYKTKYWVKVFAKRWRKFINIFKKRNITIVFIGMPNMKNRIFRKKMEFINKLMKLAVLKYENATFISAWKASSTAEGKYQPHLKVKGKLRRFRSSDGVHYAKYGARKVVNQLFKKIIRAI